MAHRLRAVLATNQPLLTMGIERALEGREIDVFPTLGTCGHLVDALRVRDPDILIVDATLLGHSVIKALKRTDTAIQRRVIALVEAWAIEDLRTLLASGVAGVVRKDASPTELLECVEAVCRGGLWPVSLELSAKIDARTSSGSFAMDQLTPRQLELAVLLTRGWNDQHIAQELGVTKGSVRVFLHRIYRKLKIENRTQLAILMSEFSNHQLNIGSDPPQEFGDPAQL